MRRKILQCRWACVALLLGLALPLICAWLPRRPILHGVSKRPFPAIFHLDYPLARANAWLAALAMAEARLPASINSNLPHLGVDQKLARLAFAALLFPVDVVTPEKANGVQIRVFLKDDANLEQRRAEIDSWRLLLEMCLLWETAKVAQALREEWPRSVNVDRAVMARLEAQAELLRQLWIAVELNALDASPPSWNESLGDVQASVGILLACALEAPERSLAKIERAVELCLAREANAVDRQEAGLWNRLAVYAIHLRGLAHERFGQTALAAADFDAALARLAKVGIQDELAAAILGSRAELRKLLGNLEGMCQDLVAACGIGSCSGLAAARRQGLCRHTEKEP